MESREQKRETYFSLSVKEKVVQLRKRGFEDLFYFETL